MSYNNNIPLAPDKLSVSQSDLLNNMMAIESLVEVDHVDFNAPGQGKHQRVSLIQNTPTAPPFDAGDVGLYGFASPVSLQNEMFISSVKQSTVTQVNATGSTLSTNSNPTVTAFGFNSWTFLPSGLLMVWGSANISSTMSFPVVNISYPAGAGIPVFSKVFNIQLTVTTGTGLDNNSAVILQVPLNQGPPTTYFSAIGVERYNSSTYKGVNVQYVAVGIPVGY